MTQKMSITELSQYTIWNISVIFPSGRTGEEKFRKLNFAPHTLSRFTCFVTRLVELGGATDELATTSFNSF